MSKATIHVPAGAKLDLRGVRLTGVTITYEEGKYTEVVLDGCTLVDSTLEPQPVFVIKGNVFTTSTETVVTGGEQ